MEIAGVPERIASRVVYHEDSGCMEFTGYRDAAGYGQVRGDDGRNELFHRYMYRKLTGKSIPPKHVLDHLIPDRPECPGPCKIGPACGCPAHLEPVTVEVNSGRVVPWNRRKTHCSRGHLYAEHGKSRTGRDGYTRRYCGLCEGRRQGRYPDA